MERKPFLLRLDPKVHRALERWADDEFRSVNAQIEFVLRKALAAARRLPGEDRVPPDVPPQP
ncbi:MAG TPA: hypothetical protein VNM14_16875 [Planctomycetota bacterium]|jgi:hypothetical protein|nr:hypothetical protein [Planctomycetota bacterium]